MIRERKGKPKVINFTHKLSMTQVNPFSINLWKGNPRINDQSVEKLALLIAIHGQRIPIVVWEKNATVYKGNTTLKAIRFLSRLSMRDFETLLDPIAKELKKQGKACLFHKPNMVFVTYQDFPDEKAAIDFALADNKSSEWSQWDEDLLDEILDYKEDPKLLSLVTGFSESELQNLSLIPDINKINGYKEQNKSFSSVVKLIVPAEMKSDLIGWLEEELPDANFTNVIIR